MYKINFNFLLLSLLDNVYIDWFLIKLLIKILMFLMLVYFGFLAFIWIFMHIGSNGKFIQQRLKIEFNLLTRFHFFFILWIYTLLFIFNHVIFFCFLNTVYTYTLLFLINYLFLNIIFHAYLTGVSRAYNYLGVINSECLFFGEIKCLIMRLLVFYRILNEWNDFILFWEKVLKIITMPFYYLISLLFENNNDIPFLIKNFKYKLVYFIATLIFIFLVIIFFYYIFYNIYKNSSHYNKKHLVSRSKRYVTGQWKFSKKPPSPNNRNVLKKPKISYIPFKEKYHAGHFFIYNRNDKYGYVLTSTFLDRFEIASEYYGPSLLKTPHNRWFTVRCVLLKNINLKNLQHHDIPLHGSSYLLTKLILYEFFNQWDYSWSQEKK